MNQTIFIKPRDGVKVRDPLTGEHLPEAGAEKPRGRYWLRRLNDGDVQIVSRPKAPAKGANSSTTTSVRKGADR